MAGMDSIGGIGGMQNAGPGQQMNRANDSESTQNTDGAKPDIGKEMKELVAFIGRLLAAIGALLEKIAQQNQQGQDPSAGNSASDPSSDPSADPSSGGGEDSPSSDNSGDASPKSKNTAPNGNAGNVLASIGKGMSEIGKGMMDLGGGGGGGAGGGGIGQSAGA